MEDFQKAGALILNKNLDKCLMVFQKSSSLWGLPKGGRESKESSYSCMIREVKEEVGLDLNRVYFELLEKFKINSKSFVYFIKLNLDPLPVFYPPLNNGNENHEILKIEWVPINKISNKKINSFTRNSIKKFNDFIECYEPKYLDDDITANNLVRLMVY